KGAVWAVAASLRGGLLASAGQDGTIALYAADTGKVLRRIETPQSRVRALAFSPDGKVLASTGVLNMVGKRKGLVVLWDVQTGRALRELDGHTSEAWALAFAPDGKSLVSAGR